jgi:hypothetical protein
MSQKISRFSILLILFTMLTALLVPVSAQDMMGPAVEVSDQVVVGGWVSVDYVYSDGPGFIVIHIDSEGRPGPVIGYRQLSPGANYNVTVPIDAASATPVLYAMLHVDTGEIGVYEFGMVEGVDGPAIVDGAPVTPPFNVAVLNVHDQFLDDNTLTAASVTVDEAGWLAVHVDSEGRPGPVAGYAAVEAGINLDVTVELDESMVTPVLWPMLHVDTGEIGVYEFGTVEGVDGPVRLGGAVAVTPIWTVPFMRIDHQIVTPGDGMDAMAPTLTARSVFAEEPGWLAVHTDSEGRPGPVAGYAAVEPGLNTNVTVALDESMVTPVLWPMLHVDTGEVGVYEFGTVEGVDGPVRVNDQVVVFSIFAAPAIVYDVRAVSDSSIVVAGALIDAPGWLAIHVDSGEGRPGPVAGYAPLTPGWNSNIVVAVDADMMTPTVFPMLHYDTGELGVYEFGTVEGADGPVRVDGNVVVGPADVVSDDDM